MATRLPSQRKFAPVKNKNVSRSAATPSSQAATPAPQAGPSTSLPTPILSAPLPVSSAEVAIPSVIPTEDVAPTTITEVSNQTGMTIIPSVRAEPPTLPVVAPQFPNQTASTPSRDLPSRVPNRGSTPAQGLRTYLKATPHTTPQPPSARRSVTPAPVSQYSGVPALIAAAAASPGPLSALASRSARASVTPIPPPRPPPPPSKAPSRMSMTPVPSFIPRVQATPASPASGLPPQVMAATPESEPLFFGVPPVVRTFGSEHSGVEDEDDELDPATLAAAAVASIRDIVPPPKKRTKRGTAGRGQEVDQENGESSTRVRKMPPPKRLSARRRAVPRPQTPEEGDQDNMNGSESSDEASHIDDETYGDSPQPSTASRNVQSRRSKKDPRRRKRIRREELPTSQMNVATPDEMLGEAIDPSVVTMADLAQDPKAGSGKVSQRGIRLWIHAQEEDARKKRRTAARQEDRWREKQIQRRKLRAMKNADRARRRIELGQMGFDQGDVSVDEDDSEEEYEVRPDRLTPPSTPDPDVEQAQEQADDEGENDQAQEAGEEENAAAAEGDDAEVEGEQEDDEEAVADERPVGEQDGTSQQDGEREGVIEGGEEGDEALAALARAGFNILAQEREEGDEGDEEEDEDGNHLEEWRERQEEQRRRLLEDTGREVMEEDDETRMINSASFSKKHSSNERWLQWETEFFFQVLGETGENYTVMKAYFPFRTVQQLRRKGVRENKENPEKMTQAILHRKPMDIAYLQKSAGFNPDKDWSRERALFEAARQDMLSLLQTVPEEEIEGGGDEEERE
ncbi:hypothetical protein M231_05823 [Tremella mesenterica]|uniref:Transcription factor TFIIIB component B'' Myb domain-containing protein n=1 Tax=Tremella mesenterica TaxID=5217 RepID=A0A4Q1BH56_TREME|nr:hypothetical protein M231_05823 [Tremella mesenterica]